MNLSENAIATAALFNGHAKIIFLDLKKNKLTDCSGLCDLLALEELYLGENEITNTDALKNLPHLKKLDLNTNKLTTLNQLPALPMLQDLDVGTNTIAVPDSINHLERY